MPIVKFPRLGGGTVSIRSEYCHAWAPTSDIGKDKTKQTDIMFAGTRLTVDMPYEEVDKLLEEARR
jgi:hypothetical protein